MRCQKSGLPRARRQRRTRNARFSDFSFGAAAFHR